MRHFVVRAADFEGKDGLCVFAFEENGVFEALLMIDDDVEKQLVERK